MLRAPELYAWVAVALAGMVFQQASFRAGALTASLPTMTLAKPVVGWILGITVLSEELRVDDEKLFVLVAAVALMVVSTWRWPEARPPRWRRSTGAEPKPLRYPWRRWKVSFRVEHHRDHPVGAGAGPRARRRRGRRGGRAAGGHDRGGRRAAAALGGRRGRAPPTWWWARKASARSRASALTWWSAFRRRPPGSAGELPLAGLIAGWMRAQAQPDARARSGSTPGTMMSRWRWPLAGTCV